MVLWVYFPPGLRSGWEITDRQKADGLCFDLTKRRSHSQVGTEKGGGFSPVTTWGSPVRQSRGWRRGCGTEGLCGGPQMPQDTLIHSLCRIEAAGIYYSSQKQNKNRNTSLAGRGMEMLTCACFTKLKSLKSKKEWIPVEETREAVTWFSKRAGFLV